MQKTLQSLSVVEHSTLKEMGVLWEFFPEATGIYSEDVKPVLAYEKAEDPNVDAVVRSYLDRAAAGMLKYGVTTEDNPLSLGEWLDHAQQELMDATIYLERIKQELKSFKSQFKYVYYNPTKHSYIPSSIINWEEGTPLLVLDAYADSEGSYYTVWNTLLKEYAGISVALTKETIYD